MFHQTELSFLCEVFEKSHVRAAVMQRHEIRDHLSEIPLNAFLDNSAFFCDSVAALQPQTIYKLTDFFGCCYHAVLLPDAGGQRILCIGPYLPAPISAQGLLEIGEQLDIPPQMQGHFGNYYAAVPVIDANSHLWRMLECFCERIWRHHPFSVSEIRQNATPDIEPISKSMQSIDLNDTLANIKMMEERYAFENEMIRAVTLGHTHKESQLFSAFSAQFFEKRAADPLRNAKNYAIIMNTLLRKAAEQGGVHPIHLDRVSSEYAVKIESLASLNDNYALMCEMFRTYCRLVQKHALQKYSPIVKKTILLIDTDLSANLTLAILADRQEISAGYLSTVFKKETGTTVSEYIRLRRMEYASYLLDTTDLQIQTVALHCGIMDVQYFSKLFKRQFGKSPTEYRDHIKSTRK